MIRTSPVHVALVTLAALMHASCIDPVRDDAIAALGPEAPGVPRGETHRAGQPCLTCHDGNGPGSPIFTMAGTVFELRGQPQPAKGVAVTMSDNRGASITVVTNDVGNFYVRDTQFTPSYPVSVALLRGADKATMESRIGRSGSCAECHLGAGDSAHSPAVYLRAKP